VLSAVVAGGSAGAAIDLRSRRVPNGLTLGLALVGATLPAVHATGLSEWGVLGGFTLGLVLMLPGHIVGATGAGDVKFFAALGTLLGPVGIATAFLYTAIAGGVVALVVAARRRRLRVTMEGTASLVCSRGANSAEIEHASSNNRFAYAPAIAIGSVLAALGM
jgi:prepilin peptidase CpaA